MRDGVAQTQMVVLHEMSQIAEDPLTSGYRTRTQVVGSERCSWPYMIWHDMVEETSIFDPQERIDQSTLSCR